MSERILEVLEVERHEVVFKVRALSDHRPILICERVFHAECLRKVEVRLGVTDVV